MGVVSAGDIVLEENHKTGQNKKWVLPNTYTSTITRAVDSGAIVIVVSFGPSVVFIVNFFPAPPERSYVLAD
jgi:hypothetical protein